jgi:hypothetical protein
MDTDPPTRLAVGYLENNATYAVLDGKYWPRMFTDFATQEFLDNAVTNTSGNGPREWLFVFLTEYSETENPEYAAELTGGTQPILYWATFNRRGDVFSPTTTGEDRLLIIPAKINTSADVFEFTAPVKTFAASQDLLDEIKTVPNPFYMLGGYDPNPGVYAIKFHHLPEECTIRIYNLGGDLVRTIEKTSSDAIATWDILTENGLPVASGIYIWVVDAPGFGTKVGKMAVFVEQEVLDIY